MGPRGTGGPEDTRDPSWVPRHMPTFYDSVTRFTRHPRARFAGREVFSAILGCAKEMTSGENHFFRLPGITKMLSDFTGPKPSRLGYKTFGRWSRIEWLAIAMASTRYSYETLWTWAG
eukprot:gene18289-biopygen5322